MQADASRKRRTFSVEIGHRRGRIAPVLLGCHPARRPPPGAPSGLSRRMRSASRPSQATNGLASAAPDAPSRPTPPRSYPAASVGKTIRIVGQFSHFFVSNVMTNHGPFDLGNKGQDYFSRFGRLPRVKRPITPTSPPPSPPASPAHGPYLRRLRRTPKAGHARANPAQKGRAERNVGTHAARTRRARQELRPARPLRLSTRCCIRPPIARATPIT